MSLFSCSDGSLLAELVSHDAGGDASGEVLWHSYDAVRLRWPVGHLDFDLVKAALMPETMTERHLGPL